MKRMLSVVLALAMLLSMAPVATFDVQATSVSTNGSCGENLTWTLDNDGLLTISGTGEMESYGMWETPWADSATLIKKVVVEDGVDGIGSCAFFGCSNMTEVSLPSGLRYIDWSAFEGCKSLLDVTIPDGVTAIGMWAFSGCAGLTEIVIPDSVTGIYMYAFQNCNSLKRVTIGSGVSFIGEGVFSYCEALESVRFEGNAPTFDSGYNESPTCFCGVTATVYYPQDNATWTEDVRQDYLGDITWVGYSNYVASGTCGDNLTWKLDDDGLLTISGTGSMKNYTNYPDPWDDYLNQITAVVMEEGIISIGDYAFRSCSNLTSVSIPDSVTSIGYYAFHGCSSLIDIAIPDGVTSIGNSAFRGCSSITSIAIPDGIERIGTYMFYNCSGLTSVVIPDSIIGIVEYAFYNCSSLCHVLYKGTEEQWNEIGIGMHNDSLTDAVCHYNCTGDEIVNGVCTICNSGSEFDAQGTCGDNLTWKVDANGLLTISGTGAMYDYEWENPAPWHVYNEQIYTVLIEEGVTNIGALAFSDCINMTGIVIPDSVTSIGYAAFNACSSLTNITIPDAVTSMEDAAFYGCSNLQSIELPAGLTNIAWSLFDGCSSLECIVIPDGVTSIGGYAFSVCNSLTSIVIPDSVMNIDRDAFNACDNLWHVLYKGTDEQWNAMFVDENPCLTNAIRHYNCTGMEILDEEKQICILCDSNIRQIVTIRGEEITVSVILDQAYTVRAGGVSVTYDASVLEYVGGQWHVTGTLLANVDDAMHTGAFAYTSATQIEGTIFTYTFKVLDSAALETSWLNCSIVLKDGSDLLLEVPSLEYAITVTEHIYESVVTAPTCTEGGFTTHTCTLCGESYTDSYTDPLGHSEVVQPAVAPTCTLTGLTEGKYCATCGEVFAQQQAVPALGHSYRYRVDTAPTDAAGGILKGTCSVCSSSETVELPVLNTADYAYSVEVEATYTTTGIGRYTWNNDAYGCFYFDVVLEKLIMPSDSVVTVGSVTGKSGETVEVILTLADAPNIRAMGLSNFVYDRENLTLISGEWLLDGAILSSWDENMQAAAIAYMNDTDLNGAIFKLTFQIHEDAPEGTYTVSCDATAKIKPDDEDITIAVASEAGDVTVKNYVPGDVDGDEAIDTDDAIYLLYYTLFGDSMYPLNQLGDFDGDGTVDTDDAIYLLYYTLFGDSMYPLH